LRSALSLRSALTRYRVLAYATGVFLLLLTLHVILQVGQRQPGQSLFDAEGIGAYLPGGGAWVPAVHGWLYLIYVVVSVDLWFRTRLNVPRMIAVVLAGTIPFMSFVAERWVRGQLQPMIERASVGSPNA
jgi:integral membrane protein